MSASTVLAAGASCTGECQKSGPLGLATILILCVACYFLFKSMSKHMRKVREGFPAKDAAPTTGSPDTSAADATELPAVTGAADGPAADRPAAGGAADRPTDDSGDGDPQPVVASDDQAGRTAGSSGP